MLLVSGLPYKCWGVMEKGWRILKQANWIILCFLNKLSFLMCVSVQPVCIYRYMCLPWPMFSCVKRQFNYLLPRFSSVQSLKPVWLCDPMDCSMPDFPVLHPLSDFALTHVHWVGDAIQPSHPVDHFFSCLQSFPASGSFQMSQFFMSGHQSFGVSASASVLPMNIQRWFPLELTGLISLLSKRLSRVFLWHHNSKASILWRSALLMVQLSHLYMTAGKTIVLPIWTFVSKLMSLLLNTLSRCVAAERICELEGRTEKKI